MNQVCKVCGEPAAGFHFGAFTCEGCKSFFGRSYNNPHNVGECKNNNGCAVNRKNRTSCKSCRLRKCLLVGMSKQGSRYGRRSNWFKIHCLLQSQRDMHGNIMPNAIALCNPDDDDPAAGGEEENDRPTDEAKRQQRGTSNSDMRMKKPTRISRNNNSGLLQNNKQFANMFANSALNHNNFLTTSAHVAEANVDLYDNNSNHQRRHSITVGPTPTTNFHINNNNTQQQQHNFAMAALAKAMQQQQQQQANNNTAAGHAAAAPVAAGTASSSNSAPSSPGGGGGRVSGSVTTTSVLENKANLSDSQQTTAFHAGHESSTSLIQKLIANHQHLIGTVPASAANNNNLLFAPQLFALDAMANGRTNLLQNNNNNVHHPPQPPSSFSSSQTTTTTTTTLLAAAMAAAAMSGKFPSFPHVMAAGSPLPVAPTAAFLNGNLFGQTNNNNNNNNNNYSLPGTNVNFENNNNNLSTAEPISADNLEKSATTSGRQQQHEFPFFASHLASNNQQNGLATNGSLAQNTGPSGNGHCPPLGMYHQLPSLLANPALMALLIANPVLLQSICNFVPLVPSLLPEPNHFQQQQQLSHNALASFFGDSNHQAVLNITSTANSSTTPTSTSSSIITSPVSPTPLLNKLPSVGANSNNNYYQQQNLLFSPTATAQLPNPLLMQALLGSVMHHQQQLSFDDKLFQLGHCRSGGSAFQPPPLQQNSSTSSASAVRCKERNFSSICDDDGGGKEDDYLINIQRENVISRKSLAKRLRLNSAYNAAAHSNDEFVTRANKSYNAGSNDSGNDSIEVLPAAGESDELASAAVDGSSTVLANNSSENVQCKTQRILLATARNITETQSKFSDYNGKTMLQLEPAVANRAVKAVDGKKFSDMNEKSSMMWRGKKQHAAIVERQRSAVLSTTVATTTPATTLLSRLPSYEITAGSV